MGLILGIDSSAAQCAAALVLDGETRVTRAEPMTKGQAERLAPLVQALLAEAGAAPADLSAIAVCTGPGNFTGVRIGVAFARGLSLSVGRPAVGVPRLDALAAPHQGRVLASSDARRGECHARVCEGGRPLSPLLQGAPETLAAELSAFAPTRAIGPAADAFSRLLDLAPGPSGDLPDPVVIAALGARRLAEGAAPRPAPEYPRPPDAALPSERPPRLLP